MQILLFCLLKWFWLKYFNSSDQVTFMCKHCNEARHWKNLKSLQCPSFHCSADSKTQLQDLEVAPVYAGSNTTL